MRLLTTILIILLSFSCTEISTEDGTKISSETAFDESWVEVAKVPSDYRGTYEYARKSIDYEISITDSSWVDLKSIQWTNRTEIGFVRFFNQLVRHEQPKSKGMILCIDADCSLFYRVWKIDNQLFHKVCMPDGNETDRSIYTCNEYTVPFLPVTNTN